jgi:glyoxylase-like metal-dependent hydrolase (beta-lactamase superfamily II)/rhodanese-related sulfurtransferase
MSLLRGRFNIIIFVKEIIKTSRVDGELSNMTRVKDIELPSESFHKQIQAGWDPLIIDVRNSQTYADWHIFNSVNFPIMQLLARKDFYESKYQNRELVLVCTRGKDSLAGAEYLQSKGLSAKSLKGGLLAWNNVFDTVPIVNDSELNLIQFRRVSKGCLSYLLYSGNEAIVFDPAHNISPYLEFAEEKDLSILKVIDTHLHADHVSGARELANKTGAELFLNPNDPFDFEYKSVLENDSFTLKNQKSVRIIPTPGHTPGSTSFVMKDIGVLTGDLLFVDGIGRPDLLEKTAEFAKDLYHSLTTRIAALPNDMFYAPSHHGKFEIDHFNKPIISNIDAFKEDKIIETDEETFIKYSVEKSSQTKQPGSYETIRLINIGKQMLTPLQINEMEIGPNRCAIS